MKNFKIIFSIILIIAAVGQSQAQSKPWIFGIGWNIVDDNGKKEMSSADLNYSLNGLKYPTSLRIEKYINKGLSGVFNASYNEYEGHRAINSETRVVPKSSFASFDLGVKFDFNHWYDLNKKVFNFKEGVLDCYMSLGAGYTMRDSVSAYVGNSANANLGIGINVIAYKGFGFNLDATGKFGLADFWSTPANYTMYTFGLIYQIQRKTGLVGERKFN